MPDVRNFSALVALAAAPCLAAETSHAWPDADEVRALVADMLADAETRSSLAGESTSGYDAGFVMADADHNFRLRVGGQMQFRYVASFTDNDAPGVDDFTTGFANPRTRVFFDGHVYDPALTYRVMLDVSPGTGNAFLQDAWVGYAFADNWQVRAGQVITAFLREWFMGDFKLFTVERSAQALIFGQNRSQFVDLKYQDDDFRVIATLSDGFRSANTDLGASPADFAFTTRAEWKHSGEWKQVVDEFRSPRGSEFAGALGGALHYERGQDTNTPGATPQDLFAWTADWLVKGDGWNAMVAGVGYHVRNEANAPSPDFDDMSVLVQGGFHATDDLELIARYDVIFPDRDRAANDDFHTLTLGFNYYIHGQAAKFSFAALWAMDATTDTAAGNFAATGARNPTGSGFGLFPSAGDQVSLMAQFQLLF